MQTDELLLIAREIIDKVPLCFAITVDSGVAHARVIEPSKLAEDWSVRFITSRQCRKIEEMQRSGHLTLAYQYDPEGAYVTLEGRPTLIDEVDAKRSLWKDDSDRWFPGGPEDPTVVVVELSTERIELWSSGYDVMPEPKGLSAAVLERDGEGWRYSTT
jgi:general stress protein 26